MQDNSIYQKDYYKNYSEDLLARKYLVDEISNNIDFRKKVVLDAGCDGGFLSFFLAKTGAERVYGCDISPQFIDIVKKRAKKQKLDKNTDFLVCDIHKLPYKKDFFDIVVCSEVLEHVNNPQKVVDEFYRVLKKGGKIVLTTPNIINPFEILHVLKHHIFWIIKKEEITHIQHFTYRSIKKLFSEYKILDLYGVGFGAAFLPQRKYNFIKMLDRLLGRLLKFAAYDIFVIAEKVT